MVKYDIVEIHDNEYIKVLEYIDNLAHDHVKQQSLQETVILVIPGR